jgi:hypothetical protein
MSGSTPDLDQAPPEATPAPGDDSLRQQFVASRAVAARPNDDWIKALAAEPQGSAGQAGSANAPAAPAPIAPAPSPDVPITQRVLANLAEAGRGTIEDVLGGWGSVAFAGRLRDAVGAGASQSLKDLASAGDAVAQGKSGYQPPTSPAAQPLAWSDLLSPGTAAEKAAYQVAHGAPVLAAGIAGGIAGGAATSETGPGAAVGAIGGGALSAGAMAAAQSLGPYYATALKANPQDPQAAFSQAVTKAGTDGVFSAAGFALFGFAPFEGAVKNLMLQAFGVQPAVAVAQKVTQNAEDDKPLGEGVADAIPGAIVGTVLPAVAHAAIGAALPGADEVPAAEAVEAAGNPDAAAAPAAADAPAPEIGAQPDQAAPTTDLAAPAPGPDANAVRSDAEVSAEAPASGDQAPSAAEDPFAALHAASDFQKPKPRDFLPLGDRLAERVTVSPEIADQAEKFLSGGGGENPVKINLAYVDGTDALQDMLARVSSFLPKQDVRSHDTTDFLASTLGVRPQDLIAGYQGKMLDAAEMRAASLITMSGAQQLGEFAAKALDPATATPETKALAVKAFATQMAIQKYFENAKSEAGRTLNILQSLSKPKSDYAKAVNDIITKAGGGDVDRVLQQVADLGDPATGGDPSKISQYMANADKLSGRDLFLYGFYNTILSNVPHILAKKGLSDATMGVWNLATRYTAEKLGTGAVAPGETAAMAYGYAASMQDAIRLAGRGIVTGDRQFEPGYGTMDAVTDPLGKDRITALADGAPPALTTDQPTRGALDYLKMALPTRWIGAADDLAKYVNYRAELRAMAFRDGTAKGLGGQDLADHIDQTMDVPPVAMHEQAVTAALRSTFQEPLTGLGAKLQDTADSINIPLPGTSFKIPFGRMILPFVKIPANMAATVYRNSPLPLAFPSEQIKAELAAGGATRDLAISRIGLGSAGALATLGLALGGLITGRGPNDPSLNRAWRAAGNQPYSLTIGGTPYSYNQVDPVGMMLGAVADSVDTMRFAHDQSRGDIASSLMFGMGNAMLSKTYLSGLSNFFDALQQPEKEGSNYVDRFASSLLVPGAVAAVGTATDPWMRAHYDLLDSIEARLPILREGQPPLRSLWGDPIPAKDGFMPPLSGTGLARAVSPVGYGQPTANAEPIDKWIWDNRDAFPHADSGRLDLYKPGPVQSYEAPGGRGVTAQVHLSPQQLDRLQVLSGNELKDPSIGLGAKDLLNALVTGATPGGLTGSQAAQVGQMQAQWQKLSPAAQAQRVLAVADKFKGAARQQLMREDPGLADTVTTQWGARRQQLTTPGAAPSGGGAAMPSFGG